MSDRDNIRLQRPLHASLGWEWLANRLFEASMWCFRRAGYFTVEEDR